MYKSVVIGIASAGGVGAVGVGGYALFGNGFGFGGANENTAANSNAVTPRSDVSHSIPSDTTSTQVQTLPPQQKIVHTQEPGGDAKSYDSKLETLNNLNEVIQKGECFKEAFGENTSLADTTDSNSIDLANTDFGEPITIPEEGTEDGTESKSTGCVFVQTNKVTYPNNGSTKYTGIFSWAWAFRGKDKGLAVFGVATTNTTSKNLDVEGVVYILEKENSDDSETGKVTHSKKSEKKELSSSEAWSKLPQATNNITGDMSDVNWNGLKTHELNSIADDSTTGGTAIPASYKPSWEYDEHETNTKIYDGCKDLAGFDNLFGSSSSDLKSKLDKWKGGG